MKISGIRLELTDACDLRCKHCLRKHARPAQYLPVDSIRTLISQAAAYNTDQIWLTGGEPTLHPQFEKILKIISGAGYKFTLFTNGIKFERTARIIGGFRKNLEEVRISLDGAKEATHDCNRGRGTFRAAMEALNLCRREHFPFSLNTVISRLNKNELPELARLAARMNCRSIFFSHLQLTRRPKEHGLELTPRQSRQAEKKISLLGKSIRGTKIHLCAGAYAKNPLLLCPVPLASFYIDCRANLSFCALLSSTNSRLGGAQIIANLRRVTLSQAQRRLLQRYTLFARSRMRELFRRRILAQDHFPCTFCLEYFKKTHA